MVYVNVHIVLSVSISPFFPFIVVISLGLFLVSCRPRSALPAQSIDSNVRGPIPGILGGLVLAPAPRKT